MNDLPFCLGGERDGTEPVVRCSWDSSSSTFVEDDEGDSACLWSSVGGWLYVGRPEEDETLGDN